MVSVFFADTVNVNARQMSTITSIILAIPCDDREPCRRHPHTACPAPHGERGPLQVHQLGEDGRFLTESLDDNVQHDCEEDVKQQWG